MTELPLEPSKTNYTVENEARQPRTAFRGAFRELIVGAINLRDGSVAQECSCIVGRFVPACGACCKRLRNVWSVLENRETGVPWRALTGVANMWRPPPPPVSL